MRIIGGEWRTRVLHAPRGPATRPTSDRLRETLFNVLGQAIAGARFADLFAGSGAVGLEALSRGAAHCTFVENARPAFEALSANVEALQVFADRYRLIRSPVNTALRREDGPTRGFAFAPWDYVFLDPPYEDTDATHATLKGLGRPGFLSPGAIVAVEHSAPGARKGLAEIPDIIAGFERYRVLVQGEAALSFFQAMDSRSLTLPDAPN